MLALLMPWFPLFRNERRISSIPLSHISFTYYVNNEFLWVYEPFKMVILYMYVFLCISV